MFFPRSRAAQEKRSISYVLHLCIPQRSDIFKAEEDWEVKNKVDTKHAHDPNNPLKEVTTVERTSHWEATGSFLAERWIMEASVSLNVDGNIFFAMCESTLSGRSKLHLKVGQTLVSSKKGDRDLQAGTADTVTHIEGQPPCCNLTCCLASHIEGQPPCCSLKRCLSCKLGCPKCDCCKFSCPKLDCCKLSCPKCDCCKFSCRKLGCCKLSCSECACPKCPGCSDWWAWWAFFCGTSGKTIVQKGKDAEKIRAYSTKVEPSLRSTPNEEELAKMYLESYLFDHRIGLNKEVLLKAPAMHSMDGAIVAKGNENALSMQRHILHIGYRRLNDGEAAVGRVFLAAKQDHRQMQKVMSILASHLVPLPQGTKLQVDEQPQTFTAPKKTEKGMNLPSMSWGAPTWLQVQASKKDELAEETDGEETEGGLHF